MLVAIFPLISNINASSAFLFFASMHASIQFNLLNELILGSWTLWGPLIVFTVFKTKPFLYIDSWGCLYSGITTIVGFELDGGIEAGKVFIDSLELIYHVANIGDARTLAIHPASTTHSQLSEADQLRAGVTPGYIRLSVGIEHIKDIIADIDQAIQKVEKKG